MPLDVTIIAASVVSFVVFFVLKAIVFRVVHSDAVLKWIVNVFVVTSVLHLAGTIFWNDCSHQHFPGSFPLLAGVSYLLFGLSAFVYILCVFGPSETSIRIRLLREIQEQKGGRLTHEALLTKYNGEMILKRRIQRLLLAQTIVERNGRYEIKNKSNAFFLIDAMASLIQRVLRKS